MPFLRPNPGKLSANQNVPGLIKALRYGAGKPGDKEAAAIRVAAAKALGATRDTRALSPLEAAKRSDRNQAVRRAAKAAVKRLQALDLFSTDVAIVGGGIAGCYVAWRLTGEQSTPPRRVALFEAQSRLGGRIHSVSFPGLPCPAELGPMRFSPAQHRIAGLIDKLELHCHTHFEGFPTRFYLRSNTIPPTSWMDVYRGLDKERQPADMNPNHQAICQFCGEFETDDKKAELPGALVSYGMAACLRDVFFREEDDFKKHHTDEAQKIQTAVQSLDPKDPKWGELTRILGENGWEMIKRYGWIHLDVGEATEDVKLSETGFWNVLQHYLGNEAFLLIHDAGGYESIYGNWNAAEAIKWYVDDFQDAEYRMPSRGFQRIIDRLEKQARDTGCGIHLNHRLKRIHARPDADFRWELEFEVGDGVNKGRRVFVMAKSVILALPQRALELLKLADRLGVPRIPEHQDLYPQDPKDAKPVSWKVLKEHYFSGVRRQKLLKIFMLYSHPWWEDGIWHDKPIEGMKKLFDGDSGRVFTDLPIRQIYYFGSHWMDAHKPEPEQGQVDPQHLDGWSLIMASYSDAHYVDFWRPFAKLTQMLAGKADERFVGDRKAWDQLERELGPTSRKRLETLLRSREGMPDRMVHKVRRQLAELHGIRPEDCPEPLMAIYMDWGQQPRLKAGWHTWEVNSKTWAIFEGLIQPFPELYICGEAFSHYQGWIEGALETADRVLRSIKERLPSG